jgi:hypothetical protein
MARVHRDLALVDMVCVHVVKMSVVEVIDVTVVPDRAMAAVSAVDMIVAFVDGMAAHRKILGWLHRHRDSRGTVGN